MNIEIEELAKILNDLYGFIGEHNGFIRDTGQAGIFFAIGAVANRIENLCLEQDPDFDVKQWRIDSGFARTRVKTSWNVKDQ